jgi:hypothetical protein
VGGAGGGGGGVVFFFFFLFFFLFFFFPPPPPPIATEELGEGLTPKALASRLIQYAVDITQTTRKAMEATQKRLPNDYQLYPGKLDHSTILCMRAVSGPPKQAHGPLRHIAFTPLAADDDHPPEAV